MSLRRPSLTGKVRMGDLLTDLLALAGIESRKEPKLKIIIEEEEGFTEEIEIESFKQFIELFKFADALIITVHEPEIRRREGFRAKNLTLIARRIDRDWKVKARLQEQEFTKDLWKKLKEVIEYRTEDLIDTGLSLIRILSTLSILLS